MQITQRCTNEMLHWIMSFESAVARTRGLIGKLGKVAYEIL